MYLLSHVFLACLVLGVVWSPCFAEDDAIELTEEDLYKIIDLATAGEKLEGKPEVYFASTDPHSQTEHIHENEHGVIESSVNQPGPFGTTITHTSFLPQGGALSQSKRHEHHHGHQQYQQHYVSPAPAPGHGQVLQGHYHQYQGAQGLHEIPAPSSPALYQGHGHVHRSPAPPASYDYSNDLPIAESENSATYSNRPVDRSGQSASASGLEITGSVELPSQHAEYREDSKSGVYKLFRTNSQPPSRSRPAPVPRAHKRPTDNEVGSSVISYGVANQPARFAPSYRNLITSGVPQLQSLPLDGQRLPLPPSPPQELVRVPLYASPSIGRLNGGHQHESGGRIFSASPALLSPSFNPLVLARGQSSVNPHGLFRAPVQFTQVSPSPSPPLGLSPGPAPQGPGGNSESHQSVHQKAVESVLNAKRAEVGGNSVVSAGQTRVVSEQSPPPLPPQPPVQYRAEAQAPAFEFQHPAVLAGYQDFPPVQSLGFRQQSAVAASAPQPPPLPQRPAPPPPPQQQGQTFQFSPQQQQFNPAPQQGGPTFSFSPQQQQQFNFPRSPIIHSFAFNVPQQFQLFRPLFTAGGPQPTISSPTPTTTTAAQEESTLRDDTTTTTVLSTTPQEVPVTTTTQIQNYALPTSAPASESLSSPPLPNPPAAPTSESLIQSGQIPLSMLMNLPNIVARTEQTTVTSNDLTSAEESLLDQAHMHQPEIEIRQINGEPVVTVKTRRVVAPSARKSSTKSIVTTRVVARFRRPKNNKNSKKRGQNQSKEQQQHEPMLMQMVEELDTGVSQSQEVKSQSRDQPMVVMNMADDDGDEMTMM